MEYYINPLQADAVRLNNIIYSHYIFDGVNYIPPYDSNTTSFIDVTLFPIFVYPLIMTASTDENISLDDRNFIQGLLVNQKTYDEAVLAGWITPPPINQG